MWPYEWTKNGGQHLMLFLKTHAEEASQVPTGAWDEIGTVLSEMSRRLGIPGGALYVRFGDPAWTGATLRHVHAHVLQKSGVDADAAVHL
jgi:diadenosine tetraphosphate (Ap4A) HIT family hydrolase